MEHIQLCCLCSSLCVCQREREKDCNKRELFFLPQSKLSSGLWWKNQMDSLSDSRIFTVWLDKLWPVKPAVKEEYDAALSGNRSCDENYLVIKATKGLYVDSLFAVMTLWAPTPKAKAPYFFTVGTEQPYDSYQGSLVYDSCASAGACVLQKKNSGKRQVETLSQLIVAMHN